MSDVTDQRVPRNGSTGPLQFTVADAETPAGSLVVTARSSNAALVAASGITFGGSGENRTVTVTPRRNRTGTALITLTVTDAGGLTATDTFVVRVRSGSSGGTAFAVGLGGGSSTVLLMNPDGTQQASLTPFPGFGGGVRTASADFNGDGVTDLVAGTGPGASTRVRVLDGATGGELFAVAAFEAAFTGGVFVAAGDLTGDGVPDLVVTPDEGGGPRARVFSGADFAQVADFLGIEDPNFRGGARPAVGDLTGDGVGDLVVAAGFGGGPRVAVWDGTSVDQGAFTRKPFGDQLVFEVGLRNGTFVTAGDLTGDGFDELIVGGGPGGGPRVLALDGQALVAGESVAVANFFAGDTASRGGVRVVAKDLDDDGLADLVAGAGAGSGSRVAAYGATALTDPSGNVDTFGTLFALDAFPGETAGVFVG